MTRRRWPQPGFALLADERAKPAAPRDQSILSDAGFSAEKIRLLGWQSVNLLIS